ncbi:NADPH-dependent 2,4-dienoyl-CoA reductase/sulfur reductase-like enzyme [Orenia metallireducens]|jgi:NADPH-dependent 2,4-dienoyl-CoA reductase/sulfur reductase-like enzyme|uniref:NADPH-dependent 2,4-dienoyl-CoA reductase, sulfur reductase n=1 Tax=Orenia metallireducens TaxID=1413210 RepID=A0A285F1V1_9FIRM|nr:FAD-dependent oxidoreductase [Orenia metallireducens]PRX34709.1 NADPH-dependent 2,4-dienoyl-CoA reductase/sulfur reductase-like enzyme [Orenia metallireducens]SNY05280.1 NADPH-dependent 2,4-dienoyl-CoA reductase, sulfur reductase [Orenia metallireducens]
MKIVVIGGVAAGTSAAARAKRINPEAEIVIFERDSDISYSGCGLPYYISNIVEARDGVIIYTPERFEAKKGAEVKAQHSVEDILVDRKEIVVRDILRNEVKRVSYDKLLIATGASPIVPEIKGIDLDNIFPLRNVHNADRIIDYIQLNQPKKAVVIGGGYIGLELTESLLEYGIEVSVVEKAHQLLTNLDADMAEIVAEHLEAKGVELILGDGVVEFQGDKSVKRVITESGQELDCDFVILAIGVRPNTDLAKRAGIECGNTGAIKVNSKMETNIADIYAAGDCVESINLITGQPIWVPLGSTANKHGRVAGSNLCGVEDQFKGILGTAITKVCDLAVGCTGLTVREAEEKGYKVVSSVIKAGNHAGYYPGYTKINIKLVVEQDSGRILGGQIVGKDGVDKRVDVLATAIHNEMKAAELIDLDLSYAPPFSVPKDGLMIAGLVTDKKRN